MLGVADSVLPFGANWYDVVVAVALIYGIWSGVRNGLTGELIMLAGYVLMVVLALHWYVAAGRGLCDLTGMTEELSGLVAFVGIALAVYLLARLVRTVTHRWMKKVTFAAHVEIIGGGVAGWVRMTAIMFWVTIMLCLVRSPVWHEQVGRNSLVGRWVISKFPLVAANVEKQFPEKMWFLQTIKRPKELNPDEDIPKKQP